MQQRENRWIVVDLIGKGGRICSIAMPSWAKGAVETWMEAAGLKSGRIFRAMRRGDRVAGEAITFHSIYAVVTENATRLGLELAPHDLRRTHAKLAYRGGSRLEQARADPVGPRPFLSSNDRTVSWDRPRLWGRTV
jgi:integrase